MAKNKHLTDSERLQIEQWLRNGISLKQIAVKLDKSTSTVSRIPSPLRLGSKIREYTHKSFQTLFHILSNGVLAHNRCHSLCKI
jgi:IS30 family transposase